MTTLHTLMKKLLVTSKPRTLTPRLPMGARPSLAQIEARHIALHAKSKTKTCCF